MANLTPQGSGKPLNRNLDLAPNANTTQNGKFVTNIVAVSIEANADMLDRNIFVANRPYKVVGISEVHKTQGTDGSAVTVNVEKLTGTTAAGSGTALHTGFNLKGANATVQAATLTATEAQLRLDTGDRLGLNFVGTQTSVAGVAITIDLIPV